MFLSKTYDKYNFFLINQLVIMSFDLESVIRDDVPYGNKANFIDCIKEVVTNSINSIEDHKNTTPDYLVSINFFVTKDDVIHDVIIFDNACGFDLERIDAYQTLGTRFGEEKGCKGIGRFIAFSHFKKIQILDCNLQKSIGFDIDKYDRKSNPRGFFTEKNLQFLDTNKDRLQDIEKATAVVLLSGCKTEQILESDLEPLKQEILDSIWMKLFYLYYKDDGNGSFTPNPKFEKTKIHITRLSDNQFIEDKPVEITISDIPKPKNTSEISEIESKLYHFYIPEISNKKHKHRVFYIADNIKVSEESLGLFKGDLLKQPFVDGTKNNFYYCGILSGKFLDKIVDKTRTDLSWKKSEYKKPDVDRYVYTKVKEELQDVLNPKIDGRNKKIDRVKNKNPKFCLLSDDDIDIEKIEFSASEEEIEKYLTKIYSEKSLNDRTKFIKKYNELQGKIQEISAPENKGDNEKHQKLDKERKKIAKDFESALTDFNKKVLASYVCERFLVMESLKQYKDSETREEFVHNTVYPQYEQGKTPEEAYRDHNLWLLDDNLVYNHFEHLASDIELKKNEALKDGNKTLFDNAKPDILISYPSFTEDKFRNECVVIEFKRPGRDDYEGWVTQVNDYVLGVFKKNNSYKKFKYILIAQPDDKFNKWMVSLEEGRDKWRKTIDQKGWYVNPYTLGAKDEIAVEGYIYTYEKLILDAEWRNKIFFDRLNLEVPKDILIESSEEKK